MFSAMGYPAASSASGGPPRCKRSPVFSIASTPGSCSPTYRKGEHLPTTIRQPMPQVPLFETARPSRRRGSLWYNRSLGEMRIGSMARCECCRDHLVLHGPAGGDRPYLDFVVVMALVTILSFQLPVVMTLLGAVGIMSREWFAKRRKYRALWLLSSWASSSRPSQDFILQRGVSADALWIV